MLRIDRRTLIMRTKIIITLMCCVALGQVKLGAAHAAPDNPTATTSSPIGTLKAYQVLNYCRQLLLEIDGPSPGEGNDIPPGPINVFDSPTGAAAPTPGTPAARNPAPRPPLPAAAQPMPPKTAPTAQPPAPGPQSTSAASGKAGISPNDLEAYCRAPEADSADIRRRVTVADFYHARPRKDQRRSNSRMFRDGAPATPFPSVGWQSQAIDGMMTFFLERAKSELLHSALAEWRDRLCADSAATQPADPSVQTLLPQTCNLLKNLPGDNLPNLGTAFRAAFIADLEKMPISMLQFIGDYSSKSGVEMPPELKPTLEALRAFEGLFVAVRQGVYPLKYMSRWETQYTEESCAGPSKTLSDPVHCALYIMGTISSQQLRNEPDIAAIASLSRMIVQDLKKSGRLRDITEAELQSIIDNLQQIVNDGRDIYDQLKKSPGNRAQIYAALNQILLDTTKTVLVLIPDSEFTAKETDKKLSGRQVKDKIVSFVEALLSIEKGVIENDYGKVAIHGIQFVQNLLVLLPTGKVKLPDGLVRLVNLASDVATAKNSEEVKKAFESVASPLGSYKAKRVRNAITVSVSGYLGLSGGLEWLASPDTQRGVAGQVGAAGLIGVDLSYGVGANMSVGALLSVFDLGALLNFRLASNDPAIKTSPEIGFAQIVSPGVFFVWGLCNRAPIVLGIGGQLTPNLRAITPDGAPTYQNHALRLSAMLAVDTTFLRF